MKAMHGVGQSLAVSGQVGLDCAADRHFASLGAQKLSVARCLSQAPQRLLRHVRQEAPVMARYRGSSDVGTLRSPVMRGQ